MFINVPVIFPESAIAKTNLPSNKIWEKKSICPALHISAQHKVVNSERSVAEEVSGEVWFQQGWLRQFNVRLARGGKQFRIPSARNSLPPRATNASRPASPPETGVLCPHSISHPQVAVERQAALSLTNLYSIDKLRGCCACGKR
jgi:hypothetical protein